MARVKGKTESGFEYEIDDRIRRDRKVVKLYADLFSNDQGKQYRAALAFAPAILGDEQAEAMEDYFRSLNDGFCDNDAFDKEVTAIFLGSTDYSGTESKEAKNL